MQCFPAQQTCALRVWASAGSRPDARRPPTSAQTPPGAPAGTPNTEGVRSHMRVGLVTYNLARSWDLDTIVSRCQETGFEGVELRTTHAHGVEVTLSPAQRRDVRQRFHGSGVELVGLGSAFEFHSADPDEARRNVDGTKEYVRLAHDVGASGVKVRPNGLPEGVQVEDTLRQIGESLAECAEDATGFGVQIRLEVHGPRTQELPNIRRIIDHADHENLAACWNSNPTDVVDGSIEGAFALAAGRIGLVHINELHNPAYPYRDLFRRLAQSGYDGFCLAETAETTDPVCVMQYYRALFQALQPE